MQRARNHLIRQDGRRGEGASRGVQRRRVLAVAIMWLCSNCTSKATGHGSLSHQLAQTWQSFAAYVVSFLVIGVIWANHHAPVRADRVLLL